MTLLFLSFCILCSSLHQLVQGEELWRADLSKRMNFGVSSPTGFEQLKLVCGSDRLEVTVQTEDDFRGVIYTRGSFYSRKEPCFQEAHGGRRFHLNIPYDQCNIQDDGDKYEVTVILQHDRELIMPGDGAFALQCHLHFKDNQTMKVSTMSSISLADPDPSGKDVPTHMKSTVTNPTVVVFRPSDIRPRKPKPTDNRVEL